MVVALTRFTPWAVVGYAGTVALMAAITAGTGWLVQGAMDRSRVPLWVALPVAWTAAEWLRAHLPWFLAFPWMDLGTTLTGFPEVVGFAELVGARGVGFWLALVNAGAATLLITSGAPGRRSARVAALALIALAPPGWGIWRASTLPMRPAARVSVIQPAVPQEVKRDARVVAAATTEALERVLPVAAAEASDLVVLPEALLLDDPRREGAPRAVDQLHRYAAATGTPVLFGAIASEGEGDRAVLFNAAFLMTPGGLAPYRYDKRRLVPVVEGIPAPVRAVARRLGAGSGYGVGVGWPLAEVGGVRYGTVICYESTYSEAARALRLAGADVLANLTNDAWFGGEAWWARTPALWQHPAHLVMRAIENRVGVVRSANTGISLFVDPLGRVHDATTLFEPEVRTATVLTTDVRTVYTRFGDLVGRGAALAALLLALVTGLGARAPSPSLDPTHGRH